ncbi:guanine nucleotide-binding protein-like proteinGTP-binding protein-like protein [Leptomonas pyrrhocoris]|uniref:Guanine nucleotide-binding protein-like 1 n=1 Tax=Leptomonas pyrrhocoris TaxID=157538 RepID=A0A0N0VI99_LEPPY|nr:guanine nucleotide-binding protein-like proteinGTP-binding protein-like protein [Leptomonas pyrrhocoris]KPA86898.1 guanine nucleotide-binding protein-like proteinGTP-binding protein-like protein [Leptomonas pyrrhocoris]|eukprot:XP_015665337.1 guanine nucleotide-binding protein-like proteinGTP-binding protein-like protein [Leptomonas pyrrhocoris]
MPPFSGKKKKEQLQAKRQRKRDDEERANALEREREKLREELVNHGEAVDDTLLEAYMQERHPRHHDPAHGRRAHRPEREQNAAAKSDASDKGRNDGAGADAGDGDGAAPSRSVDTLMYSADHHHGVRSVFAKESAAVLAARKKLSYQPIPFRTTMPVTGIPFGEWFTFPSKVESSASASSAPARTGEDAEAVLSAADKAALVAAEQERKLERPLVATTAEALGGGSGSAVFPFAVELPSRGWHMRSGDEGDELRAEVVAESNRLTAPAGAAASGGKDASSLRAAERVTSDLATAQRQEDSSAAGKSRDRADTSSDRSSNSSSESGEEKDDSTCSNSAQDDGQHGTNSVDADARRAEALLIKGVEQERFAAYVRCLDAYPLPEEIAGLDISSYERNLEVWQQLWRTVELSDVLVVVADARYPILHVHLGLLTYITKAQHKPCVFVLNKEDLVPASALRCWQQFLYRYLIDLGFSVEAPEGEEGASEKGKDEVEKNCGRIVLRTFTANPRPETAGQRDDDVDVTRRQKHRKDTNAKMYEKLRTGKLNATKQLGTRQRNKSSGGDEDSSDSDAEDGADSDELRYGASENFVGMQAAAHALQHDRRAYKELEIVARKITELLALCRRLGAEGRVARGGAAATPTTAIDSYATSALPCPAPRAARKNKKAQKRGDARRGKNKGNAGGGGSGGAKSEEGEGEEEDAMSDAEEDRAPDSPSYVHIGFIGHPNVGKSSLLNCIRGTKVVSVSATPGHTKHIQTIPVPAEKLTLVDSPGLALPVFGVPRPLQAVLGTHQIAQTRDPQSGVSFLAAYLPIEKLYGLHRPDDAMTEDEWSSYELCEAYAKKRGYYVKHGKGALDIHRAAIAILQEAYEGRLGLFYAPPELNLLQSAWYRTRIRPHLLLTVFGPSLQ